MGTKSKERRLRDFASSRDNVLHIFLRTQAPKIEA